MGDGLADERLGLRHLASMLSCELKQVNESCRNQNQLVRNEGATREPRHSSTKTGGTDACDAAVLGPHLITEGRWAVIGTSTGGSTSTYRHACSNHAPLAITPSPSTKNLSGAEFY